MNNQFKSGFVALVGRPNVGKSSLLNTFIGQKINIVSEKPQTTRNQLRGILTEPNYQIIWIDTPGLHRPLHELGGRMQESAIKALESVDLVLWILDASMGFTAADAKVAEILAQIKEPLFAVWNKADLARPDLVIPETTTLAPRKIKQVSALTNQGMAELLEAVVEEMPVGSPFYPDDQITDQPERFIVAELIREQVLQNTSEEVPHSVAVVVDQMKERPNGKMFVNAVIYVERDSQKGIIIGAGGERLKKIGQDARATIEYLLDFPVYLDLWVKVRKNWRNKEADLKEFGYSKKEHN